MKEVDEDSVVGNERKIEQRRKTRALKEERRRIRREGAVSNAPLDRQESCIVS